MHARAIWPGLAALPVLAILAGCPASAEDVRPPDDGFYFPTGLAITPDERYLFVSNANSDLRFGSSSLLVVDLDVVDGLVRSWLDTGEDPPGCNQDLDDRASVICAEEQGGNEDVDDEGNPNAPFMKVGSGVRLGNFVGEVKLQELDSGNLRLFVPSRGDPSITWVDFDGEFLECGGSGDFPRCDGDHQLEQIRDDPDLPGLTSEPFGVYVDGANGHVVVAHLTSGNISLASSPPDESEPPLLVDVKGGFFGTSRVTGLRGAVAVEGRQPGTDQDLIYVTSRAESRVQMLHVEQPSDETYPLLVPTDYFFLNTVFPAEESRGMVFSADGNRAHIINRRPPTLITVDTSLDREGRPYNEVIQATELCPQAGLVTLADVGQGPRAYVTCFRDGQIWVIDPEAAVLESVINVGRGPHAMAISPSRSQMYVTNFLENTVAVIDLTPGVATENRVVVRLGKPSFGEDQ